MKRSILAVIAIATACGRNDSASHVDHDLGRALNDESIFQWHDTTDDEYFNAVIKYKTGVDKARAVADDHEATRRLQFWVDAVDSMLRAREGDKFKVVPKPKVKLILNPEANAFVASAKLCLNLGVAFAGSEADSRTAEAITFDRSPKYFERTYGQNPDLDCIESTLSQDQEVALTKWQFSPYPDCAPNFKDGMVVLQPSCLGEKHDLDNVRRGKRLIVYATSNQITVLSHVLAGLSEDQMVEVLAHELGHYYMSHQTAPSSTYGMFYRLKEDNPGQKPKSEPEAESLGKKLTEVFKDKIYFEDYAAVDGQHYHSLLFSVVRNMASDMSAIECAGDASCQKPCKALADFFNDSTKTKPLNDFPWKKPRAEGVAAYHEYEQRALACVADIKLTDAPGTPGTSAATAIKLDSVQQYLGYSSQMLAEALKPLPLKESLGQLLDYITGKILETQKAQDNKINGVLSDAMAFNLSVYTTEQEADELSAEWINELGVNPAVGIEAMISLGREWATQQQPAFGEISADRCEALYKNGWRDEKGRYLIVPVAAWEDNHHSSCFRAFNIDRDIKVHNLTGFASRRRPQPEGPSWEQIVTSVKALEASMPPESGPSTGGTSASPSF